MGKNIVLCFDGTWNSPESETNVYKIFKALGPSTGEQKTFYYTGVGAEGSKLERAFDGATGEGILDKMRKGYDDLASIYEPGDRIYIFGFSRGGFTARCLASMLATFGLPTRYYGDAPETKAYTQELGDTIFDEYRHRAARGDLPQELRDHCVAPAPVEMVGVFDSVSSLGAAALYGGVDKLRYDFLDANWHPGITNSYQALAIDERRSEFAPERWHEGPGNSPTHKMEQKWFPGVHADVGGGYHNASSDPPLTWMIGKAMKHGLGFDREVAASYAVEAARDQGETHESWKPKWGIPRTRDIPAGSDISSYVALRAATDGYAPRNLPFNNAAAKVAPDGTDWFKAYTTRGPGDWVPLPWDNDPMLLYAERNPQQGATYRTANPGNPGTSRAPGTGRGR